MKRIALNSWNAFSTRFVLPPRLTWERVEGAARFRLSVADPRELVATDEASEPAYDFAALWDRLPEGPLDLLIQGFDSEGTEICMALSKRLYKVPGFDGVRQEPLDWVESTERNLTYLLAPARDEVKPYEVGLPRSCWCSHEDCITGQRSHYSYPALHHPSFILCYLTVGALQAGSPHAAEALRQARQYADWLLENRHPATSACSLFPYSTVQDGLTHGGMEGKIVTLVRAGRVGEAMVAMFQATGEERYFEYALHLARKLVDFQREDGSWPYRVNPDTGEVTEEYTSNVATPCRFFNMLTEIVPDAALDTARQKAEAWLLNNPVKTHLWQGMYEDIGRRVPYKNLQNWDTNESIRYLLYRRENHPEFVAVAEALNGYIEDQFVVWQEEESPVVVRCPTPTVLEQYTCYYPMQAHNGNWLLSLMELHRATGNEEYLAKGVAAANSIVKGQQACGSYSTWGNDRRFGRPLMTREWPGGSAMATTALLKFHAYYEAVRGGRMIPPSLIAL